MCNGARGQEGRKGTPAHSRLTLDASHLSYLLPGAIAAGGVAVGIYTTNNVDACQYISEHSEAEVIVVENAKQLEKFVDISHQLPNLKVGADCG